MASASPSVLPTVNLNDSFTVTVAITPDMLETISSVTCVLTGSPSEPITILSGSSNVTISGKHINTFSDQFTYTDKGETDQTQTPKTVIGLGSVPDEKNLFNLVQDSRQSETRTYIITVNGSQNFNITQQVLNPLEVKRQFMANYNYNGYKGA